MISSFQLKFGRTPGRAGSQVAASPVTVFVGPNNSGKSKVLMEIEQYCRTGNPNSTAVILHSLTYTGFSAEGADAAIQRLIQPPNPGEMLPPGAISIGSRFGRMHVNADHLKATAQNPGQNPGAFCQQFLTHYTVRLDGQGRITLVNQQPAGDLQQPGHSTLQVLFRDDARRKEVRRIVAEAFGENSREQ